ncbi:MAG TPA: M20/M25/M40 family metallo-hydrolase, partial [Rhodospirillales bacterium]|nr:M20/M25/M40 family metallo-hydrolase [Rhodospirillales bacterium]
SKVEITSFDVGNRATNVIPSKACAAFNVRFNDRRTGERLTKELRKRFDKEGAVYDLEVDVTAEPFLTSPGPLSELISAAVEQVTGRRPDYGTTGGTSDARFIKDHCPVVEFGLISETAHGTDEHVNVADLETLSEIYLAALNGYFKV